MNLEQSIIFQTSKNLAEAKKALVHLGSAWRGDWSDFDGRTLRSQLDRINKILDGELTFNQFCDDAGICKEHGCWLDNCCERTW